MQNKRESFCSGLEHVIPDSEDRFSLCETIGLRSAALYFVRYYLLNTEYVSKSIDSMKLMVCFMVCRFLRKFMELGLSFMKSRT
jgi:hypothetical protein